MDLSNYELYSKYIVPEYYKNYKLSEARKISQWKKFIPFIKEFYPAIAATQKIANALSLIHIEGVYHFLYLNNGHLEFKKELGVARTRAIVGYGLSPLLNASIIREEDAEYIMDWFSSYENDRTSRFITYVTVKKIHKYSIYPHAANQRKSLLLELGHIQ